MSSYKLINIISLVVVLVLIYVSYRLHTFVPKYYPNDKFIQKSDIYKPKKLMVTAHPDDEILWGYRHLSNNPKEWKVICISTFTDKVRLNHFKQVMNKMGVKNYEVWNHNYRKYAHTMAKECVNDILKDIQKNKYKLIMTHNFYGEYGNLQHISVHREMDKLKNKYNFPVQYFSAGKYRCNKKKDEILNIYTTESLIISLLRVWGRFF